MIRLAIDVGSRVTKIYQLGSGVVLAEATCVAVEADNGNVIYKAFGDRARALSGKAAQNTHIVNPVKEGEIVRPDLMAALLSYFLQKIEIKPSHFKKIEALFVLPCGYSQALRETYAKVAANVGIGRVSYTALPYAAVCGHHLSLRESEPVFCVDIGYGVTNVAVVSLDGIIAGFTVNLGGGNIDVHLMDLIAENFGLKIGALTAERLKNAVGNLLPDDEKLTVVDGVNIKNGAPSSMGVRASQTHDVVKLYVDKILEYATLLLNELPAEVAATVMHGGLYLSGGMARCEGLPEYVKKTMDIPVHVAEEPHLSTVVGAGTILSSGALRQKVTCMD